MSGLSHVYVPGQSSTWFRKILVVVKQTAYEEYSQLRLRGQAPKALRWKRLENRYKTHKSCVNNLLGILRHHHVDFSCINRVELDRQHLADVDLLIAVGGDGTALSSAHFLDHGTIPLLGINSDPITESDIDTKKKTDERRSHGALCMCTANNMADAIAKVLYGGGKVEERTRVQCTVKSTFAETRLVPALNDLLIANPSPAAVSRFRMGWLEPIDVSEFAPLKDGQTMEQRQQKQQQRSTKNIRNSSFEERNTLQYHQYGTVTRFENKAYDIRNSLNVWSSGMWLCTATGATAAMAAAGGMSMEDHPHDLQYLIREHMIEKTATGKSIRGLDNCFLKEDEQLHLRWNSHKGRIFIDGSHLSHDLELGDEIMINARAPPLQLFVADKDD